ncbi:hypothetical protein V5P93_002721 [Actinokineospora auranticolor]|uniref:Uncharacterized protein n=1 Tax=Actinokineospora auranticolor TaxID=155976 RepID=A0A2S6H045_9PSEU|nr:hypothetical protein [Actinokineospora auranticolor]PPK70859.1 hypothetical protein CLV40_10145 [Actinokineospora auranticolor]
MDSERNMRFIRRFNFDVVNQQRVGLAAQRGWRFDPDAPWLLDQWPVLPFTVRGDMRHVYGAVTGVESGMEFTAFQYFRRPTVVNHKAVGITVRQTDQYEVESVFVVSLPVVMPFAQVWSKRQWYPGGPERCPRPQTHDPKFNRRHRLIDTDPAVAAALLTPQLVGTVMALKLGTWSLVGSDLVYTESAVDTGSGPEGVLAVLARLAQFVPWLPYHLGQPKPGAQPHRAHPGPQQQQPVYPPQPRYSAPQPYPVQQPYPQQPYPGPPYLRRL